MKTFAHINIRGHVAAIKPVGNTLKIRIGSSKRGQRKPDGTYDYHTQWNEVTVFSESTQKYVKEKINQGDVIEVNGEIFEKSYEKDGETIYGITLACYSVDLLQTAAMRELWKDHHAE